MRRALRSLVVVLVAICGVVLLGFSLTFTSLVQLLATTALIMGGTNHPLSTPPDTVPFVNGYMADALRNYIDPGLDPDTPVNTVAVIAPNQFFPVFGSMTFDDSVQAGRGNLNSCLDSTAGGCEHNTAGGINTTEPVPLPGPDQTFIVFGYSQSAVIASLVKRDLMAAYAEDPESAPGYVPFVLVANPMRPNGGILARGFEGMTIPGLGITFHGPTPTNSCETGGPCYPTVDVAQQYDFLGGDAPVAPLNVFAMANSLAAYYYLHGAVPSESLNGAIPQGTYGDTTYYLLPADRLPLLMPFEQAGVPGPILAVLDAPLRVIVEAGYDRESSPGEHVQFRLMPIGEPVNFIGNLAGSIPVGLDDGFEEAGIGRPFSTTPAGPFGVGGGPQETATLEAAPDARAAAPDAPTPTADQPPAGPLTDEGQQVNATPQTELATGPPDPNASEEGTRPRLLRQIVRGPIEFDRPKPPADRPSSGNRPLQRIIKALTGQRPAEPDGGATGEPNAESENESVG